MGGSRDGDDGIKSSLIITEVQKRPSLYDSNHRGYVDRTEKARSWEEVYQSVVPGWSALSHAERFTAGKEVQKRWRSIRDSYTKAYRQGKCVPPEQCPPGSRRSLYHKQMAFLLKALQNKKPRYSQERYESYSEVSSSPQHPPPEDLHQNKNATIDKPLDLKTKPDIEKPETQDKCNQATMDKEEKPADLSMSKQSLEIKIDANSILPDDHFDDDRLFMNSLIPLFKKMDDDTRLLCRIEVLKIMRYALQGHQSFEALRLAEDRFFQNRISGILSKEEVHSFDKQNDVQLSVTTRSGVGTRPIRKRKTRSPSPLPMPPKKRGPGRPRKIRPPPSDSDEEHHAPKQTPKLKVSPIEPRWTDMDESLSKATSVAQLSTPLFMKMYNLERSKPEKNVFPNHTATIIKTEPIDEQQPS